MGRGGGGGGGGGGQWSMVDHPSQVFQQQQMAIQVGQLQQQQQQRKVDHKLLNYTCIFHLRKSRCVGEAVVPPWPPLGKIFISILWPRA